MTRQEANRKILNEISELESYHRYDPRSPSRSPTRSPRSPGASRGRTIERSGTPRSVSTSHYASARSLKLLSEKS